MFSINRTQRINALTAVFPEETCHVAKAVLGEPNEFRWEILDNAKNIPPNCTDAHLIELAKQLAKKFIGDSRHAKQPILYVIQEPTNPTHYFPLIVLPDVFYNLGRCVMPLLYGAKDGTDHFHCYLATELYQQGAAPYLDNRGKFSSDGQLNVDVSQPLMQADHTSCFMLSLLYGRLLLMQNASLLRMGLIKYFNKGHDSLMTYQFISPPAAWIYSQSIRFIDSQWTYWETLLQRLKQNLHICINHPDKKIEALRQEIRAKIHLLPKFIKFFQLTKDKLRCTSTTGRLQAASYSIKQTCQLLNNNAQQVTMEEQQLTATVKVLYQHCVNSQHPILELTNNKNETITTVFLNDALRHGLIALYHQHAKASRNPALFEQSFFHNTLGQEQLPDELALTIGEPTPASEPVTMTPALKLLIDDIYCQLIGKQDTLLSTEDILTHVIRFNKNYQGATQAPKDTTIMTTSMTLIRPNQAPPAANSSSRNSTTTTTHHCRYPLP